MGVLPVCPHRPPLAATNPNHCHRRELAATAELIFLPYNYLIDERTRAGLGVRWQDAVLIFDEAHNVEARWVLGA